MTLPLLEPLRAVAEGCSFEAFVDLHPNAILVLREVVDGDLHYANPGQSQQVVRPGNTMLHLPRVTAAQRVHSPRAPNRRRVERERYFEVAAPADGTGFLSVGRKRDCHAAINDFTVSSMHARLYMVPTTDWVFLVDAGSRNGTAHNGNYLSGGQRVELVSGDEVQLGRCVLLYLSPRDAYKYLTRTL